MGKEPPDGPLEALVQRIQQLEERLAKLGDELARQSYIHNLFRKKYEKLLQHLLGKAGESMIASATGLTPELMEWARQQINEEELAAAVREIRETGGLELQDFIGELEKLATSDE